MYKQVLDPVGDSLVPVDPLRGPAARHALRPARRTQAARPMSPPCLAAGRDPRGDHRLLDARRPDARRRRRGRRLRPLPDHVDRRQRDLDLQLIDAAGYFAVIERSFGALAMTARPGGADRLLLRRAARGAGRVRHAGRDLLGHAHRPRLPAGKAAALALVANTAPVAFGAIAVPITTLAPADRPAQGRPRRHGRPPDALPGSHRPVHPRRHGRRPARHRQAWPAALVGGLAFAHRPVRDARTTSRSS